MATAPDADAVWKAACGSLFFYAGKGNVASVKSSLDDAVIRSRARFPPLDAQRRRQRGSDDVNDAERIHVLKEAHDSVRSTLLHATCYSKGGGSTAWPELACFLVSLMPTAWVNRRNAVGATALDYAIGASEQGRTVHARPDAGAWRGSREDRARARAAGRE
uniref:Uncharacterized protein n=1 Tax=Bicosoecida sp. CB-2014 TaxID=1486930 RepID=A0A7S1CF15_9STRA|mmetsp:Transcript_22018/g.77190  ORF Transcript_22018/g.77190 Transcript_22018/m.77190 type:complete len:162 (+) Transcript_22018:3-488(+)